MKKTKIVIIAKDVDGGTGTYVEAILSLKKYFDLYVVILNPPKYRNFSYKNTYIFPKKNPENYFFSLYNTFFFLQELFFVKKTIDKVQPKLIFAIDAHSNVIGQLFGSIYGVKTILTTHIFLKKTIERKSTKFFNFFLKKTISFLFNYHADALVGVSKKVSMSLRRDFNIKKPIMTIYHGIKNSNIKSKRTNIRNQIITVCRIDKQKDLNTLVLAIKIAKKTISNIKLNIIGDGPGKDDLRQAIERLDMKSTIKLCSWKNKINTYLDSSDVFVLSSFYEGFSYAILEAMNRGLPVISTDSPYGPKEIIKNNQYGVLVPVGNASRMAKVIVSMLKSKEKYRHYHEQSLRRSKDFPLDKMIDNYRKLIQKVIS